MHLFPPEHMVSVDEVIQQLVERVANVQVAVCVLNAKEPKKIEELQSASGAVVQPLEVPTVDGLLEKKIRVLMHDIVLDEEGALA